MAERKWAKDEGTQMGMGRSEASKGRLINTPAESRHIEKRPCGLGFHIPFGSISGQIKVKSNKSPRTTKTPKEKMK